MKEENSEKLIKILKKPMANYFSMGVDARVGMGFDKNRGTSRIKNKCVYCWEGFKKLFIHTPGVSESI